MTIQSNKSLCNYVMKSDISEHHVDILSNLFACLSLANQSGVETDHSSNDPNIMTLDVDQVRHEMREYRHKLITNMEIIDALSDLHAPRLLPNSVNISRQGNGGHRIMPVRLDYRQVAETSSLHAYETDITESISKTTQTFKKLNQVLKEENEVGRAAIKNKQNNTATPETDEIALELSQVTFDEAADQIDRCDASRRWIERAMYLEESHIEQQDTIQSLRTIIIDMAETLHVADPNARISMTSSDLLDLVHSQKDMSDNAF